MNIRVPSPLAQITYASRDDWRQAAELTRREGVARRRAYLEGSEYDADNTNCLAQLGADAARTGEKGLARFIHEQRLPEHLRLHSYATPIEEAVAFLTHRLTSRFAVVAKDSRVQGVIKQCLDGSPELSGTAKDDQLNLGRVTFESLGVGDCPARVRFDPAQQSVWLDFYASDSVRVDFEDERSDRPTTVMLWEQHWLAGEDGYQRQVTIRREWEVMWFTYPGPDGTPDQGQMTWQCVESWWEERPGNSDGDKLLDRIPTGVPFVPWGLLRGRRRKLRAERGESVITDRAMGTADRYSAVEQHSWLAARHNSHATLVVTGDQALMQVTSDGRVHKDIADVLAFAGGTGVHPVTLPTDPAMIEHQRTVLLEELYGCFGLTRLDPQSVEGLGAISGYALELLGEKSQATFEALRSEMVRSWAALCNTVLDCHAHWTAAGVGSADEVFDAAAAAVRGLAADPVVVYPNRDIEIRTGSGRVVDAARLRDDFVAGIWPLREVWRQLGKTDDEIEVLEQEMAEEADRRQAREAAALGGIEGSSFTAPAPRFGVSGGTSTTPIGTVGGVVNRLADTTAAAR